MGRVLWGGPRRASARFLSALPLRKLRLLCRNRRVPRFLHARSHYVRAADLSCPAQLEGMRWLRAKSRRLHEARFYDSRLLQVTGRAPACLCLLPPWLRRPCLLASRYAALAPAALSATCTRCTPLGFVDDSGGLSVGVARCRYPSSQKGSVAGLPSLFKHPSTHTHTPPAAGAAAVPAAGAAGRRRGGGHVCGTLRPASQPGQHDQQVGPAQQAAQARAPDARLATRAPTGPPAPPPSPPRPSAPRGMCCSHGVRTSECGRG